MKIIILKCSDTLLWYNRKIGCTFDAGEVGNGIYWVRTGDEFNTLNYILAEDADQL